MVFVSFTEILSIGALLPFLGVLTAPVTIFEHPKAQGLIELLGITKPAELLLPLTLIFITAVIIAAIMRLTFLWASMRLSFSIGANISSNIYERTLSQPYAVHANRNSSEVINVISTKVNSVIHLTISPLLILINSCIMMIAILMVLIAIEPGVAFIAFTGFGIIYVTIILLTRKQLIRDGQCIAHESTQVVKLLQEGLGGIRDIIIDGTQEAYCKIFQKADVPLRRAQSNKQIISQSPRFIVEAIGMLLIALLAYMLAVQENGLSKVVPILGAFALGAQRLLPVLQQAYSSWSDLRVGQESLYDVLELLDQPVPDNKILNSDMIPFCNEIKLNNINFKYSSESDWVLNNINLSILKGESIGFIGTTGSGKSTLIDIIMGLLLPNEGTFVIDGISINKFNCHAWQKHIAHVPQMIFLSDSSIEENIAFGIPKDEIDSERVRQSAKQAQLAELIEEWPDKYKTFVGERGIKLSGGQRQRIGIARALYKQADVIIFDEATSSLDSDTERAVMDSIENLSVNHTVLIIAHRITTLKSCDRIVELHRGTIKTIESYNYYR